jgi:hypothetical protein
MPGSEETEVKISTWRAWILVVGGPLLLGATSEATVYLPDPLRLDWCLERAEAANPEIAGDASGGHEQQ